MHSIFVDDGIIHLYGKNFRMANYAHNFLLLHKQGFVLVLNNRIQHVCILKHLNIKKYNADIKNPAY